MLRFTSSLTSWGLCCVGIVLRAVLCWIGIELKFVSIPKNLLNEIDTGYWFGLILRSAARGI
jgi:hypothetical protein